MVHAVQPSVYDEAGSEPISGLADADDRILIEQVVDADDRILIEQVVDAEAHGEHALARARRRAEARVFHRA